MPFFPSIFIKLSMSFRLIFFMLSLGLYQNSFASDEKRWPLWVKGEQIKLCAKYGEPIRGELLQGMDAASHSLQNLLPTNIWEDYRLLIAQETIENNPPPKVREFCNSLTKQLLSPNLSSIVRGEDFFLGINGYNSLTDCLIDDKEKGKVLLEDFRKLYMRNNVEFPTELIEALVSLYSDPNYKVHNGWDGKICTELQDLFNSDRLDSALSEAAMRRNILFGRH